MLGREIWFSRFQRLKIPQNIKFLLFWVGLGIAVGCLFALPLHTWVEARVQLKYLLAQGGWPFFMVFSALYNVVVVPFPYDPFLFAMPKLVPSSMHWQWWASGTGGMVLAAAGAYGLANGWLRPKLRPWLVRQRGYVKAECAVARYGIWAVALSSATPVPFSLVCWLAGLMQLPFWPFLALVLLTRGLRNALVLGLAGIM